MGERTAISWTDHTFNPWLGCTRVSEGCRHCYAEQLVEKRMGLKRWGSSPRVRTKGPWREVLKWNAAAEASGVRRRVFCASLCDVFEDAPGLDAIRSDLWPLIERCPWLDWQLLTKRPENIARMLPANWGRGWSHVWLGTSVENQDAADRRIKHLLAVPAVVRFLSCEPLLGAIQLDVLRLAPETTLDCLSGIQSWVGFNGPGTTRDTRQTIDWVIVGGESGHGHRPMELQWAQDLRKQCRDAGCAFFFKQVGGSRAGTGSDALGEVVQEFPRNEVARVEGK